MSGILSSGDENNHVDTCLNNEYEDQPGYGYPDVHRKDMGEVSPKGFFPLHTTLDTFYNFSKTETCYGTLR